MNCGQPWTTGKSHNKKSLTCKSGESVGGSQSAQSSLKDEESVKLTDFFNNNNKKKISEPVQKSKKTTEFSPKEIQNKVLLFIFQHNIFDWAILHCHIDVSVNV